MKDGPTAASGPTRGLRVPGGAGLLLVWRSATRPAHPAGVQELPGPALPSLRHRQGRTPVLTGKSWCCYKTTQRNAAGGNFQTISVSVKVPWLFSTLTWVTALCVRAGPRSGQSAPWPARCRRAVPCVLCPWWVIKVAAEPGQPWCHLCGRRGRAEWWERVPLVRPVQVTAACSPLRDVKCELMARGFPAEEGTGCTLP